MMRLCTTALVMLGYIYAVVLVGAAFVSAKTTAVAPVARSVLRGGWSVPALRRSLEEAAPGRPNCRGCFNSSSGKCLLNTDGANPPPARPCSSRRH